MSWEIKKIYIAPSESDKEIETLNDVAREGWEPYSIAGCFHYFKKKWMDGYIPQATPREMAKTFGISKESMDEPIPHGANHEKIVKRVKRDFNRK